ncbi:MAG: GntR family transcriptional regulator [Salinarimonas sp.]|nr:GntR family transcriptional regulator [Salinarimonas sp.]
MAKGAATRGNVDRIHEQLRRMAADFEIGPATRINEARMASELGVSRTPLREALNRLVAEGFLTFQANHGFFCRALDPQQLLDLYETRAAIECEGARLAIMRASDGEIAELVRFHDETLGEYVGCTDPLRQLTIDEAFHARIMGLSGNQELVRLLDNIHGRIRYVRMIGLKDFYARERAGEVPAGDPRAERQRRADHAAILAAIVARDTGQAIALMREHIEWRLADATRAVGLAYYEIHRRSA